MDRRELVQAYVDRQPARWYVDHPNSTYAAARIYERLRDAPILPEFEIEELFPSEPAPLPEEQPGSPLTERERQVLGGFAVGLDAKRLGEYLGLSIDTIHTHSKKAYLKLGVSGSRGGGTNLASAKAVAICMRNGWL